MNYAFSRGLKSVFPVATARHFVRCFKRSAGASVLMYHEVTAGGVEAWTVVRPDSFERQMKWLKRHLTPLRIDEAAELAHDRRVFPPGSVVITFDDGYAGMKDFVLPIVERLEIPITIYVATQAIVKQEPYWHDRVILSLQSPSKPTEVSLSPFGLGVHRFPVSARGEARWDLIQAFLSDMKKLSPGQRLEVMDQIDALQIEADRHLLAPLKMEDIKILSACPFVTIGAHTHCHSILTRDGIERCARNNP